MSTVEVEIIEAGYSLDNMLIKDIFFTIDRGKIVGLIGVNGAGKTVIIRAMLGKLPHINGEMRIHEHKGQYSYVPEAPTFYEGLTMYEHIELITSINSLSSWGNSFNIKELIDGFDLSDYVHQFPTTFSKGMKHKFNLLLGLIKKADFYIFDDPFTCLDMKGKQLLLNCLRQLKDEGSAILIASSASTMVDDLCDSYIYIHNKTLFMAASHNHIKVKCEQEHQESLDCLYHLDVRRHHL